MSSFEKSPPRKFKSTRPDGEQYWMSARVRRWLDDMLRFPFIHSLHHTHFSSKRCVAQTLTFVRSTVPISPVGFPKLPDLRREPRDSVPCRWRTARRAVASWHGLSPTWRRGVRGGWGALGNQRIGTFETHIFNVSSCGAKGSARLACSPEFPKKFSNKLSCEIAPAFHSKLAAGVSVGT